MAKVNNLEFCVFVFKSNSQRFLFYFPLGVSDQERMDSCRHDSAAANCIYHERDSTSETNKFAALGIRPLENTK